MKSMTLFLLLCLCAMLCNCAPIKGYAGPELPDTQISTIFLSNDSERVEVPDASIDGIEFGGSGIKVLPGKHTFSNSVVAKEPPDNCYAYPQVDYSSLSKCQEKSVKKGGSCDCYQYMSIYQKCYQQVQDGSCDGNLTTVAGAQYDIVTTKYERSRVDVRVYERASRRSAGSGTCALRGWRTDTTDKYVGSGRSDAYRYGIYGCG